MSFYRQCELRKKNSIQITWIPEEFAKKGKYIKLLQDNNTWDDGWQVTEVGVREEDKIVAERSQDYKHQRKASDI